MLGFRPTIGSLVWTSNQRNYRFSPRGYSVEEWLNRNLVVSWVAFDDAVHGAEVEPIKRHTPLLNPRDSPSAPTELSKLRAPCCEIARTQAARRQPG
ncbi:GIY-YIG nuclease family protein [Microbacterium kunmingense]|uniref:GIY-YIG nuclease family protein n=1 Tax=Microbacterium TaxID=33882 RepID=UPI003558574C